MNPGSERLYQLLDQYRQDKLSLPEAEELQGMLQAEWEAAPADSEVAGVDWDAMYNRIMEAENKPVPVISIFRRSITRWIAAAVILFVVTSAAWFFIVGRKQDQPAVAMAPVSNDIAPGGFKARLTLADGSVITLDSSKDGQLATQGNTAIVNQGKELVYQSAYKSAAPEAAYNTLATANGQSYSLTLSDGTKVWLNAASSIHFPVAFNGVERRVQVSGEVYFEVTHNASKPFKVTILSSGNPEGQQPAEVEVLGTHFNINAYPDEDALKVTLLEGSVKLSAPASKQQNNSITLKPGEQGQLQTTNYKLQTVNVENIDEILAWKDNKFYFNSADIYTIMRQLARWYNVEVVYRDKVTNHFTGMISRSVNASEVFRMLQQTGTLNIKIEGQKVIVSK
jgi:ferric-dicitrate binding protein FerR (iron transport regulator)